MDPPGQSRAKHGERPAETVTSSTGFCWALATLAHTLTAPRGRRQFASSLSCLGQVCHRRRAIRLICRRGLARIRPFPPLLSLSWLAGWVGLRAGFVAVCQPLLLVVQAHVRQRTPCVGDQGQELPPASHFVLPESAVTFERTNSPTLDAGRRL